MELAKPRPNWLTIAVAAAALAGLIVTIIFVSQPEPTAAPQAIKVSIVGNLGGTVYADGQVTPLKAYDGTDGITVMASKSVRVTVNSTGAAPSCRIADSTGKNLDDQTGAAPHVVPQTLTTGYGPAQSVDAPTWETVSCSATLSH